MINKEPIKAIAVIIYIDNFPKNCSVCPFMVNARCIPQGEFSTISYSVRPGCCPLMTAAAYKEREK